MDDVLAWFRSEVDFTTGEIERLRKRAWHLETTLHEVRQKDV